jgi:hypothetical protein
LRRWPIERRKERLAELLRGAPSTIVLNEHFEGDGVIVFKVPLPARRTKLKGRAPFL